MKETTKLFLKFFIPIFVLSTLLLSVLAWSEIKSQISSLEIREFSNVLLKVKSIESHLSPVVADLSFMVNHHNLQEFLNNGIEENKKNLQNEFLLSSTIKTYYDQIRFIDTNGMEVVRINYNNGDPAVVPDNKMQNKKDRYYFKKTIELNRGGIYASPFDLNVEGEKVEMPIKPMIRIGMPVFNHLQEKKGIVIINYRGELLLKEFAEDAALDDTVILSEGNFWLINTEGFWLKGPDPEIEWAFMYEDKNRISFSSEYSKEWKTIFATKHGQIMNVNGLFTYSTVFPFSQELSTEELIENSNSMNDYSWKVISYIPDSVLYAMNIKLIWKYVLILFFINILSLFGNLILATSRSKMNESEENLKLLEKKRGTLQTLLLKIYQSEFQDLKSGLTAVVNTASIILDADYVSIWRTNKKNTAITCMDISADSNIYPYSGRRIDFDKYPEYFEAIQNGNQIVADDAFEHFATQRHKEGYLKTSGVTSMLDSPIWNQGQLMGVFGLAHKDGIKRWTIEEQNIASQIAASIATLIETDERIKAEQKMRDAVKNAEDANRIKSEFLANMSHEIRTPMNAILGFSEILLEKEKDEVDREYLQSINSSGKVLLYLINDILDLSKIEAGKVEIINTPVEVKLIINDMKQLFSQKISEKKLDFIIEISQLVPEVLVFDEIRFRQILLNVIGNAVKFTEKGFVKISLDSPDSSENRSNSSLVINIEDSGIGIPEENREQVFDPFEQTGKGSLAKYGGTGLGLAITKRLLNLMNGSIEIIRKETQGTIFKITFSNVKSGSAAYTGNIDNG
ncbi:MAG: GAF domain-containing protein [Spirochaetales bacterium]|nr:GAF domain-containing protein [Spirochaetales bacterium]